GHGQNPLFAAGFRRGSRRAAAPARRRLRLHDEGRRTVGPGHRARLRDQGAEADRRRRRRSRGRQRRPRRPRAHPRPPRRAAAAAQAGRPHRRRGGARTAHARWARAREPGGHAAPARPPDSGPLRALLQHVRPLQGRHAHPGRGGMMMRHRATFRPFAQRDRGAILAILLTFALFSTLGILLSIRATHRSRHRAVVVEMAARQRTLAQRYVTQILLVRAGRRADPGPTASLLERSGWALLDGGLAPGVGGDDDETELPPEHDKVVRGQLKQELRLVHDLTATGSAFLANRSVMTIHLSAGERIAAKDPIDRLRVLSALTSNVSLNAARTIADQADRKIGSLIVLQAVLGGSGLLVSILLGWALITAARRQTARFPRLVAASTDLVLVFGEGGCRYASRSVAAMLGRSESDVLGGGLDRHVHADDLPMLRSA